MAKNERKNKFLLMRYPLYLLLSSIIFVTSCSANALDYNNYNIYNDEDELALSKRELNNIYNELSFRFGITVDEISDEYLLLSAILKNNNLSIDEQNTILGFTQLIRENPYINKKEAYSSLMKVDYNYISNSDSDVNGKYSFSKERVDIYNEDSQLNTFKHETIHVLFHNKITDKLPKFFAEGMTELLENEYFTSDPYLEEESYPYNVIIVKMLCELTSSDTVLKSFSTGNMDYIYKDISKFSNYSVNDIEKYFSKLDKLFKEIDSDKKIKSSDYSDLIIFFDDLYASKLENDSFDDLQYNYLYTIFNGIFSEKKYIKYFEFLEKFGVSTKIYFNSKYIDEDYSFEPYEGYYSSDIKVKTI